MKTLTKIILLSSFMVGFSSVSWAQKSLSQQDKFPITTANKLEITGLSGFEVTLETTDAKEVSFKWTISGSEKNVQYQATDSGVEFVENGDRALMQFLLRGGKTEEYQSNEDSWIKSLLNSKSKMGDNSNNSKSVDHTVTITLPRTMELSLVSKYSSIFGADFGADVSIENRAGNIELENVRGDVDLKNNYGNVDLRDITGNVDVSSRSGNMRLDDIGGNVELVSDYAKIRARNIDGNFSSTNKSGSIQLENIGGSFDHNGNYTSITAKDVKGFSTVSSKSGSFNAERIAGLVYDGDYAKVNVRNSTSDKGFKVEGKSISIDYDEVTGYFTVRGTYSNVEMNRTVGRAIIEMEKGSVDLRTHKGNLFIESSYSAINADELEADSLTISSSKAKVDITLTKKPISVDIQNSYGDVELRLDKGFSGMVDIVVEEGKIDSNLEVKSKNNYTEGKIMEIRGMSGSGSGLLKINVINGDIRIR